jgi:hypothetical protein
VTIGKFDREYSLGEEIESYDPKSTGEISLVVLHLVIDSYGKTTEVAVALSELDLVMLNKRLMFAQKQLRAMAYARGQTALPSAMEVPK